MLTHRLSLFVVGQVATAVVRLDVVDVDPLAGRDVLTRVADAFAVLRDLAAFGDVLKGDLVAERHVVADIDDALLVADCDCDRLARVDLAERRGHVVRGFDYLYVPVGHAV